MTGSQIRPDAAPAPSAEAPRRRPLLALAPLAIFAALAAVFLVTLERGGNDPTVRSVLIGSPVPEFSLPALDGLAAAGEPMPGFATADLMGKVSVVNVWGSWCGPCQAEHPFLMELARTVDDRVQILGFNKDDTTAGALAFLTGRGNPYDRVGVTSDPRDSFDWGIYGVPETFVVDAQGIIRYKLVGPLTPDNYRDRLMPAIDAALGAMTATTPPPPAPG